MAGLLPARDPGRVRPPVRGARGPGPGRPLPQRRETPREHARAGWDGEWYRRGYYDDGTPLGSAQNDECRIDAIAQAWAVLSGAVPVRFAERAMDAVRTHLIRRGPADPAAAHAALRRSPPRTPATSRAIPPACARTAANTPTPRSGSSWPWPGWAAATRRWSSSTCSIPPTTRGPPADVERYRAEPYVIAGDVYAHPAHAGRGGWTWYTGSAGWMYRAGLESILGLRRRGSTFEMDPCIPSSWSEYEIAWRFGRTRYEIAVSNPEHRCRGIAEATLDGAPVDPRAIPLARRRRHAPGEAGARRPEAARALRGQAGRKRSRLSRRPLRRSTPRGLLASQGGGRAR